MKPPAFTGWLRTPGAPWRRVCQAPDWGACWRLLLRIDSGGLTCEKLVNDGRHPEHRRPPR